MDLTLSNAEVKAYRLKKRPGWSLKLDTVLMADAPMQFMECPRVFLVLPDGKRIEFEVGSGADRAYPLFGVIDSMDLRLLAVLDVDRPPERIITIEVDTSFLIAARTYPVKQPAWRTQSARDVARGVAVPRALLYRRRPESGHRLLPVSSVPHSWHDSHSG